MPAALLPNIDVTGGTRAVSVRMVPGGRGYFAPAVYEARARQDGSLTWRMVERPLGTFSFQGRTMDVGFRSEAKATRRAEELADELGIAFVPGIRHGSRC